MPFATLSPSARLAARTHYEAHGTEGPWVVLLMGLGAPSSMWLDVPERLTKHDPPFRVLTVDTPGTGRSDRMRRPLSLRAMAKHVVAAMNAAGVDKATIVGLSMGGMVAQHVALAHAERVEGLVLLATTPGLLHGGLPTIRALRSLLRVSLVRRQSKQQAADLVADLILAPEQRGMAQAIIDRIVPAYIEAPTSTRSFVFQLLACAVHSTGRHLGKIRVPTVVVTGDDDIVMGKRSSRVLASRIPNARLEIVPQCGHGITFTHPESVVRAVYGVRSA